MKKSLFAFLLLLMIIPTMAYAHTGLVSSNPSEGQIIKEDLSQITLQFESEIEKLSSMKVIIDHKEIPFANLEVKGNEMMGTLSTPLENGKYTIEWKIVGEDGHNIEGEIPFNIEKEQTAAINNNVSVKDDQKDSGTEKKEVQDQPKVGNEETKNGSVMTIVIIIVLGILLVAGFMMLLKKKK
ncbi:copper resistance CopC family protein [Bacillus massiliigorillae]|uniref:copper resistance CopC family protein n=1 Tax=Bacillus massiliigorillae TaxID=1243664 RepID=UPI0003A70390|nr:copper resistance CopC family protein [Bacillus massiliigorillae]